MRLTALGAALLSLSLASPQAGDTFPPWTPGTLDIHQIVTGRGNSAFTIFPDGTTILVDAGDAGDIQGADPKPDGTCTPAQRISDYVAHMLEGRGAVIDYAVVTHFHADHTGRIDGTEPRSNHGDYRVRGITEVAEEIPIRTLIDRGDDYLPPTDAIFQNYRRFTAAESAAGRLTVRQAVAGSASQIVPMRSTNTSAAFTVRIVSVNDRVWTGTGDATTVRFPALADIADPEDRPTENMCSVTLRISYGPFDYFTGGDMPGYPVPGAPAWHDLETTVARAIGPTDAHVVNHHGSIEEENPFWLATHRSRVMVVPAWSATHPSPDVLKRMLSPRVYPGPRDIFITAFREATKLAIGPRATQVASDHGHVVIRVEPGGARYRVFVLADTTTSYRITSVHGPYVSE